jgi:hypothetical protein
MHILLHAGVHATDEDRLIKCLLKNTALLQGEGVAVPGPSRYRRLLRDTLQAMADGTPAHDARDILLEAILEGDVPDRMILSNDNFFGVPRLAVGKGVFYPGAEVKLARLQQLFPQDHLQLCLGLRNPATFLPALRSLLPDPEDDVEGMITPDITDPRSLRWSELISRIKAMVPDIEITLWCNEDTPLLWAHLIRELTGLAPNTKITGGFDLLSDIISKPGMQRFRAFLKKHPNMNEMQKRRVITAFLDKYALDDAISEEVDMPGWTDALIEDLTQLYEEDLYLIQRLPGVELIVP